MSISAYLGTGVEAGLRIGAGEGDMRPSDSFELVEEDSGDGGKRLDSPDDEDDAEADDTERAEGDCSGRR